MRANTKSLQEFKDKLIIVVEYRLGKISNQKAIASHS